MEEITKKTKTLKHLKHIVKPYSLTNADALYRECKKKINDMKSDREVHC